jgi:carbamoyl-phosphate synthase large subunit
MEHRLLNEPLTPDLMRAAKRKGLSDGVIGTLADRLPEQVRAQRAEWDIRPVYKMVDTCAAEFEAETPYFYSTYDEENEAPALTGKKALVIGSGPIRIGQGIEFDYSAVHAAWALRDAGVAAIMANSNPETVSTDFDTSSRLYFEPLDEEGIRDLLENESLDGAESAPPSIVQFGGQTAVNLATPLSRANHPILGSSAEAIDLAEDRRRFEDLLQRLGIPQPPGAGVLSVEDALQTAQAIGYPVLVRPSYVLGGRAMEIVQNPKDLIGYVTTAAEISPGKPVLIDKYLEGIEAEVDAICDGAGEALIPGIMKHIERAGVHSGDSMAVYPAIGLTDQEKGLIVDFTQRLASALEVRGLMNIQYVIMRDDSGESQVYVLEVNPRASRTVPFISKVTGVPMVKLAIQVMLGQTLRELGYEPGVWPEQDLVAVKAPVFSMSKLIGVDTHLGPEMKSTGEVMGVDKTFEAALAKALIAADLSLAGRKAVLLSLADRTKSEAVPLIRQLHAAGYRIYATEGTAAMVQALGITVDKVPKRLDQGYPNVVDVISEGLVDAVINTPEGNVTETLRDGFHIRRAAAEKRIPCLTSIDTAAAAVNALMDGDTEFTIQPLRDYLAT